MLELIMGFGFVLELWVFAHRIAKPNPQLERKNPQLERKYPQTSANSKSARGRLQTASILMAYIRVLGHVQGILGSRVAYSKNEYRKV